MGPIDAIFNLGVELKDGLLETQTKKTFLASLAPKAQATMHLDQATRNLCPTLRSVFEKSPTVDFLLQIFCSIFFSFLWTRKCRSK